MWEGVLGLRLSPVNGDDVPANDALLMVAWKLNRNEKFAPRGNFFKKSLKNSHILTKSTCLISNIQCIDFKVDTQASAWYTLSRKSQKQVPIF